MAKHLYSLEEASAKLSKDADGLKALVREGKLREFRDAGKVFYKAEDVDKLSGGGSKDDTGEIMLEAAEDELPSLADMGDSGGGTSVIGLAATGDEDKQKAKKEGTVISASGIGVFDDDELEIDADPMAKTQITSSAGGDAVSLEGTGGGSGLMDLTRESDDTSLGAELLDDIYPGEEDAAPAKAPPPRSKAAAKESAAPVMRETSAEPEPMVPVSYAGAAGDPIEPVLTGVMAGSLLVLVIAGSVVAGVMQGFVPDYGKYLSNNLLIFVGIALGLPLISAGVGFALGRRG
ncbi:MAG: hypothetical protein ACKVS9_07965 [Phycisphaerae bacterium]